MRWYCQTANPSKISFHVSQHPCPCFNFFTGMGLLSGSSFGLEGRNTLWSPWSTMLVLKLSNSFSMMASLTQWNCCSMYTFSSNFVKGSLLMLAMDGRINPVACWMFSVNVHWVVPIHQAFSVWYHVLFWGLYKIVVVIAPAQNLEASGVNNFNWVCHHSLLEGCSKSAMHLLLKWQNTKNYT